MNKRDRLYELYEYYRSLYILINGMTKELNEKYKESLDNIGKIKEEKIEENIAKVSDEIEKIEKVYEVDTSKKEIIKDIANIAIEKISKEEQLLVPKYLLNEIFGNYIPGKDFYNDLPIHTRVAIDPGITREEQGPIETFLLEATLFEDICLSHNNRQSIEGEDKLSNKLKNFFNRSIITNSYSLLESYLNGIAFEHYIYNKEMLNENEKKILIEWDNVNKRIKNVSLRDKVIKYPKIISGKTVPIYTEENSKEMDVIFNKYRLYRDSIIHASPTIGEISEEKFNKESYFFSLENDITDLIKNSVLFLIKKIETSLNGNENRLYWLYMLNDDKELYPEKIFN